MLWLLFAITAYFLLAVASVGDRFLLVGPLPSPKMYAFFIALLSALLIPLLLPFGFSFPADPLTIPLSLGAGFIWIVALWIYFEAIQRSEVSRVVPAVGAFVPIFTFLATLLVGQGILSMRELLALFLLIAGGVLITSRGMRAWQNFLQDKALAWIVGSAAMIAASFLLVKLVFLREPFINGFIWMRFGGAAAIILFLFFPDVRRGFFQQKLGMQKKILLPLLLFQAAGGAGFFLQNAAINYAAVIQVPLINALEGTRYLFLFLFVWLLARWRPQLLKEEMQGAALRQKIIAGAIIIFGIAFLAI